MNGPSQIPLPLRWPTHSTLEAYVTAGNEATIALVEAQLDSGTPLQALLHGPESSGKTHLLLGACQQAEARGLAVAYLSLRPIGACRADLWQVLGDPDLICLDDIDAVLGDRDSCEALFAVFNRAQDLRIRLLASSRLALPAMQIALPDLRSRLAACTQSPIRALDENGQRQLLITRAARRGLSLDARSLDYLFHRAPRRLSLLLDLLEQIDQRALERQRRISPALLREVLAAMSETAPQD